MSKTDEVLEKILKNVNAWVEFAEKKNTSILSIFGFVTLFASLNFILGDRVVSNWHKIGVSIYLVSYLVVLGSTLYSLFPKTKVDKEDVDEEGDKKLKDSDCLWFYGDIVKYSIDEYKEALKKNGVGSYSKMHEQLLSQIIVNSKIASTKYFCFKISCIAIFIGILALIACLVIGLFA